MTTQPHIVTDKNADGVIAYAVAYTIPKREGFHSARKQTWWRPTRREAIALYREATGKDWPDTMANDQRRTS